MAVRCERQLRTRRAAHPHSGGRPRRFRNARFAVRDSGPAFTGTFNNEGDNEITGWHLSDGDPTVFGLLGAKIPTPFHNGWRLFFTQQHGDNFTWEILRKETDDDDHDGHGRHDD